MNEITEENCEISAENSLRARKKSNRKDVSPAATLAKELQKQLTNNPELLIRAISPNLSPVSKPKIGNVPKIPSIEITRTDSHSTLKPGIGTGLDGKIV